MARIRDRETDGNELVNVMTCRPAGHWLAGKRPRRWPKSGGQRPTVTRGSPAVRSASSAGASGPRRPAAAGGRRAADR
jgi:hypothetical protein